MRERKTYTFQKKPQCSDEATPTHRGLLHLTFQAQGGEPRRSKAPPPTQRGRECEVVGGGGRVFLDVNR